MNRNDTSVAGLAAYTRALVERTSLGSNEARGLRARASHDQIDRIRQHFTTRPPTPCDGGTPSGQEGRPTAEGPAIRPRENTLEAQIPRLVTELTSIDHATLIPGLERLLATLITCLDIDFAYLRRIDRERRASVLVAEWPHRSAPDPDPLRVVYFDQADSPLHVIENLTEPTITRADSYHDQHVTSAALPLLLHGRPIGLLGFVKHGTWTWTDRELASLTVICSMLAQLQARMEAELKMRYIATHDDLTDLPNHRVLLNYLEKRLQPGRPGPVAALCVHLDRLKTVNDHLGRDAGDEFLRAAAARLAEQLDEADMLARFGSNHFVIVPAKHMDTMTAEFIASKIQQGMTTATTDSGRTGLGALSVGVAVGVPGQSAHEVLRRADLALREAKTQDGLGIAVYTDAVYSRFDLQDDLTLNLHSAVSDDSLILHYQPEVDLRTGRILAVEALVRWQHPTRGLLPPDSFVGVAEAANLASDLGDWVIRTACVQFADWRRRGLVPDLTLRINVSPKQLIGPNFVDRVEEALKRNAIEGRAICLEITENVSVHDLQRTHATLHALKRLDVQIAIDDFGTGYNTLTNLRALPVDIVKIDRSFVQRLDSDTEKRAIVRSIIELARSFELGVVGEGVETVAAARALIDMGCSRAQGFLIARPMPAEEIDAYLHEARIAFGLEPVEDATHCADCDGARR